MSDGGFSDSSDEEKLELPARLRNKGTIATKDQLYALLLRMSSDLKPDKKQNSPVRVKYVCSISDACQVSLAQSFLALSLSQVF